MAPYRALPRDYLSDTLLLRAMGFLVSQHGQLGAIPPPPFLSVSPLESMLLWRCDTPPSKGVSQRYLRDTLWKQGKWVRYPPLRYYLERVSRDMGGVSRTGPLSGSACCGLVCRSHVDHPYRGQISPWPARRLAEIWIKLAAVQFAAKPFANRKPC